MKDVNCKNCGAPLKDCKCTYCGSEYKDVVEKTSNRLTGLPQIDFYMSYLEKESVKTHKNNQTK